jgi:hypothetical protein
MRNFIKGIIFAVLPLNLFLLGGVCTATETIQLHTSKNVISLFMGIKISQKITYLYFGEGYKADSSIYHSKIKKSILTRAGKSNFSDIVGTNPDTKVIGGKIVLVGAGLEFKGKNYQTDLDAGDFFSK